MNKKKECTFDADADDVEVGSIKAIAQICPCKNYVIALGPIKRFYFKFLFENH